MIDWRNPPIVIDPKSHAYGHGQAFDLDPELVETEREIVERNRKRLANAWRL